MAMDDLEDGGHSAKLEGIPPYDPQAVGRVASNVELARVELVSSRFEQSDDRAVPSDAYKRTSRPPTLGLDAQWELTEDAQQLGCIVVCASFLDETENDAWFRLVTRFRALYDVDEGASLADDDVKLFVWWNAMLTVWPYWREFMSSMLRRAGFPSFTAPLLPEPQMGRPGEV